MDTTKLVTLEEQKHFWSEAALSPASNTLMRPTARDPFLQQVVEEAMERWLYAGAKLLDIGCGEGHSTLRFSKHVGQTIGADFIGEFVNKARQMTAGQRNISFEQANVLNLSPIKKQYDRFDIVTTIRCLINLCTWQNQCVAINQIADIVKPGGLLLVSEGWTEGMDGLNLRRQRAGLPPINVVDYNLLMSRQAFETAVQDHFELVDYIGLGFYLFMSRVFQPSFVMPDPPSHLHEINRVAANLQSNLMAHLDFNDCDYAGVYVLRRRRG